MMSFVHAKILINQKSILTFKQVDVFGLIKSYKYETYLYVIYVYFYLRNFVQNKVTLFSHCYSIFYITYYKAKTKDNDFEIFKIQVDDIILPWVADGAPMS